MKLIDLTDKTFNRWYVVKRMPNRPGGKAMWWCRCLCGTEKEIGSSELRSKGTNASKSCGCYHADNIRKRAVEHNLSKPPYLNLYNRLKARCKNKQIPISLSYEDFVAFTGIKHCYYCAGEVNWLKYHTTGHKSPSAINLDRVNPFGGYSKENCVVCCYRCNVMKNDMSIEDFIAHIKKILCHH